MGRHQKPYSPSPAAYGREPEPRFEYNPGRNIFKRVLVGFGLSNRLASSKLVAVPYRSWIRWLLVAILALIAVFLTPQLLPRWLGFKWSTPSDLCENRSEKLDFLKMKIEKMAKLDEGTVFINQTEFALECMELSANSTWDGQKGRVLFPDQCIPENAQAETESETFCKGGGSKEVCVDDWGLSILCKTIEVEPVCSEFSATDPDSVQKIAELNAERQFSQEQLLDGAATDNTQNNTQQIYGTADQAAEKIINRLLTQIDIASNLYIAYCMLAIIIGTPIVIYKRQVTTRVIAATFGLNKANFVAIVVIGLTIYDSASKVIVETDFPQLMANFRNDPCYLDPDFSTRRLDLIRNTCGAVTEQHAQVESVVANMSSLYYDASLCGVCAVNGGPVAANDDLISTMKEERIAYENGTEPGYIYPGGCNASAIANATATPPESGVSFARAFLGSGILAQILLKGILATWLVHLVSYFEPMTMHRGMVEIFGIRDEVDSAEIRLTRSERQSVYRFAKDKHIIPLIIWSILLLWEIVIIIYSVIETNKSHAGLAAEIAATNFTPPAMPDLKCLNGKLYPQ